MEHFELINDNNKFKLSENFLKQFELSFFRKLEYIIRLDDLFVLEKFKSTSKKFTLYNDDGTLEELDVYPIYYKDQIIYFYLPLYHTDVIQRTIVRDYAFWELKLLEYFTELFVLERKKIDAIIDIGSNIGNHALYFNKFLKSDKIYCFEPQKFIYDILKINLKINNVNANTYNYVISDEISSFDIEKYYPNNTGGTSFKKIGSDNSNYRSTTLDNFFLNYNNIISGIKIDTEGHEYYVLLGAENILKKYKPILWIEIKNNLNEICEYLSSFNYKLLRKFKYDYFFI